jgi:membrane associated rhomboid family serine protease
MFPIRSRQRRIRVPLVTSGLILCNLLVFCWELSQGPALRRLIAVWGLRPAFTSNRLGLAQLFSPRLFILVQFPHLFCIDRDKHYSVSPLKMSSPVLAGLEES